MIKKISAILVIASASFAAQATTQVDDKQVTQKANKLVQIEKQKEAKSTKVNENKSPVKQFEFDICYANCLG